jgi:anaerobic selenocysteine-containing dehydrogenase
MDEQRGGARPDQSEAVAAGPNWTRRQFLQAVGASAAGAVMFTGCAGPRSEFVIQSRVELAEDLVSAYDNWYATSCQGCSSGCGAIIRVVAGRAKKLEGNPDHPVNFGRSCARGQAVVQEEYHPDRLKQPLLRTGERGVGALLPVSWEEGLDFLVGRLRVLQSAGQTSEVALLTRRLGAAQALLAERFAGTTGAAWLRLDPLPQDPIRAAVERVFGFERLPEFDIEHARFVLSFGADFLGTWLSPVHYGYQYGVFRQGSYRPERFEPISRPEERGYLVQVEPRMSTTAANADEWVWVRPGREGLLALSMAQVLVAEGLADSAAAAAIGGSAALAAYGPERVADETGVEAERIRGLARRFAAEQPSLALAGGPAAAQTNGTDNLSAVLALNLLAGNVGRPGGVLFNPPPAVAGLPSATSASPLPEWQSLAARLRAGQIQAVLVHDANPAFGLPATLDFGQALLGAPLIVSFSSFLDETTALADLILPGHLPLEDWGVQVPEPGPGVGVLTVQQPVVRPPYDTRSFWDVLLVLADELGGELRQQLGWTNFREVVRDTARQLAVRLTPGPLGEVEFERFWVELLQRGGWWEQPAAIPAAVPAGAANLAAASLAWRPPDFAGGPQEYPFHLIVFSHNTLDDGRGAHLPWLAAAPDPVTTVVWRTWVEVNPGVATALGVREGELVRVETPLGALELPAYLNPAAAPDVLSIPMGWGHTHYGRWAGQRGANPMEVLAPLIDQTTGALAYAATRARLTRTGRRVPLPKFEGTVPARQLPDEPVLKITTGRPSGGA